MPDRIVKHSRKDTDADINAHCNASKLWSPRMKSRLMLILVCILSYACDSNPHLSSMKDERNPISRDTATTDTQYYNSSGNSDHKGERYFVIDDNASVRMHPTQDSNTAFHFYRGQVVYVKERKGNWVRVSEYIASERKGDERVAHWIPIASVSKKRPVGNTVVDPKKEGTTKEASQNDPDERIGIEQYRAIEIGMTYDQVCRIIGSEGTELWQRGNEWRKEVAYEWKNDSDWAGIAIVCVNGKVIKKTKSGLK